MFRKFLRDLNGNKHLKINQENTTPLLSGYYFKFEENLSKLNRLIHSFDEKGVPINTSYIDVEKQQLHYYPITIGQYGLAVFHSWLSTRQEVKKQLFLNIADWFQTHAVTDNDLGTYWLTEVPKPEFQVFKPWKSAFAQSRGISILLRAWQITGEEKYLATASKALIPFTKDISEGGVAVDRNMQETFYEEYVAAHPTRVLDGHGFSLFGLYDFVRATSDKRLAEYNRLALRLFNEGVEGLIRQLPSFDMGFWLRFNRCEVPGYPKDDPCTISYLRLVLLQIEVLYRITKREELLEYRNKFGKYDALFPILKMYRFKFRALKKLNRL